jgi:hypothetical protein
VLPLAELVGDERLMRPEGLDAAHVLRLREAIRGEESLPRLEVWQVGDKKCVADGYHRYAAYDAEGKAEVPCYLTVGTWEECLLAAAAANGEPRGLPRSAEYKRHQVRTALTAAPKRTDRAIAGHCRVCPTLVGKVRAEMESEGTVPAVEATVDGRGREYKRVKPPPVSAASSTKPDAPPAKSGEAAFEFKGFIDAVGALRRDQDRMGKRYPEAKADADYGRIDGWLAAVLSAAKGLAKRFGENGS